MKLPGNRDKKIIDGTHRIVFYLLPLLVDGRFHYNEHLSLAGMARPFHALDEMGYIIGGWDGLLPYGKEIDRCATEGGCSRPSNTAIPDIPLR